MASKSNGINAKEFRVKPDSKVDLKKVSTKPSGAELSKEDAKKPLSDQDIGDLLKKEGIMIARRTVAKYREMLKIQPSSKRKRNY